jgi:hypothetical protein
MTMPAMGRRYSHANQYQNRCLSILPYENDARRTLFTAIIGHLPLLTERMKLGLVDSGNLTLEGLEVLDAAFEIVPDLRVSSPTPYER